MSDLKITGYGDDLTIDDIRLGDLSPSEHEKIEKEKQEVIEIKKKRKKIIGEFLKKKKKREINFNDVLKYNDIPFEIIIKDL